VAPSTRRLALRTRSFMLELWPGAYLSRFGHGRVFGDSCPSHLSRHIRDDAKGWLLLSIDLNATALTTIWTIRLARKGQNEPKISGVFEIHRGLTAQEDPASMAEVFGDDD
jgi:hypothetical protein